MNGSLMRDGFELPYVIEGSGIPLLIVGDIPYNQKTFSNQLRNYFQIMFVSQKAFNKAPGCLDRSAYELDALVDDVEAIRQQLAIDTLMILGHSANAYIALEYAKKYPSHTKGVVMVAIAPDLSKENQEYALQNWQSIADDKRKEALARSLEKTPDSVLAHLSPSDYFIADYVRKTPQIWYDYHFNPLHFLKESYFNRDVFSYVWGEVFASIDLTTNAQDFNIPIWVALGKFDGLVAPLQSWKKIVESFSNVKITVYEKSGHAPHYEESQRFDADLIGWAKQYW
jgi:proline iminopeptidase